MQCPQPHDQPRHAGLRPGQIKREHQEKIEPSSYSCTNAKLDFADLCPVAADAGPEVCRFRDDAHRLFDGGLPSLPFEGYSGARRIYQCPGTTGMTWKFQPPSGKDSWKRSATRYKIRKVELSSPTSARTRA